MTAAHIALLAPVPLEHLVSGATLQNRVAFGSRAWEVFRKLDELRGGMAVDVYIYASDADGDRDFKVTWQARYVRHVESKMGAHPAGMKYRPPSTENYPNDNSGYWAVFWEVEDLHRLRQDQYMSLAQLTGFGNKKPYGHAFPPEGPLLIKHP